MFIIRLIAVVFIIVTFIALGVEGFGLAHTGRWDSIAAGQLWSSFHAASLDQTQAFVQRYFYAGLWDPVIAWILRQPAWLVTGIPGLGLLWLDLSTGVAMPRTARRPKFRTG
jgi:hypothetical protein